LKNKMYSGLNLFPFVVFIDKTKLTRFSKRYDCFEDWYSDAERVLKENQWKFEKDKPLPTMFEGLKSNLKIVVGILHERGFAVAGSLYARISRQGSEELTNLRKSFQRIEPAYRLFEFEEDFTIHQEKN